MGSQWATMGSTLMKIPLFAESIRKSHKILESKNVDLLNIISSNDVAVFDSVLNSYIGIVAIQVRRDTRLLRGYLIGIIRAT